MNFKTISFVPSFSPGLKLPEDSDSQGGFAGGPALAPFWPITDIQYLVSGRCMNKGKDVYNNIIMRMEEKIVDGIMVHIAIIQTTA